MLTIRPGYDNGPERSYTWWWVVMVVVVALVLFGAWRTAASRDACAGGAIETDTSTTVVLAESEC